MFCGNCGTENSAGAKCCKACGKPLDAYVIGKGAGAPSPIPVPGAPAPASGGLAPGKSFNINDIKKLPLPAIIIAIVAIILAIIIGCLISESQKTIDLDKYLTIDTSGYNGYGTAKAVIDWDAIKGKYGKKISFTKAAIQDYGGLISMMTPVNVLQEDIYVSLDPSTDLSNGDTVTYSWDIDDEISKYINCKLKYKDGSSTVNDLEQIGTFDAFEGLTVTFKGIAPRGQIEMNYVGDKLNYSDFTYDAPETLNNGDILKVKIRDSAVEACAKKYGVVPAVVEKDFTVDGLNSYMTKIADLSESNLAMLQKEAEDEFKSSVVNHWDEAATLDSLTYLGDYLLTAKPSTFGNTNNLILVYKVKAKIAFTNEDGESFNPDKEYYWCISFQNVQIKSDGTLPEELFYYSVPYDAFTVESGLSDGWWGKNWTFTGYETLDDLYSKAVTSKANAYNHEDNIK